ncbi:hapless 2-like isoform X2 [Lineus longissimus]|uniref:hapless 2-like isoform X2 n=1 Tax=Lineus longissimus TaxID=88925 RepID=UPI00315DFD64
MMEIKVIKFKFWIKIFLFLSITITLISTKKPQIDVVAEIGFCEEKVNPDVFVEDCQYKLQLSLKILNAGQLVNNKAYEVFVTKDNTDDFVGCDKFSLPRLCGYAIVGVSPEEEVVLKQKGFCCPCLKDAQQTGRYHLRGGQDCTNKTAGDTEKDTYHSSAHCLKFDPVWYSVNEFDTPRLEHIIHVTAYVVNKEKEQHSWLFIGGENEILLSPESHSVSTNNGMISATYTDCSLGAKENLINHTHKRLLIPRLNPVLMENIMPLQIKEGPSRYLLLDHDMIDMTGKTCNKAGVSYEAFVNQADKCTCPAQSCLDKQPMYYWLEDVQNYNAGRKGKYFLSNFAKLPTNPVLRNMQTGEEKLVVKVTQPHQSILYFEINADRLVPMHEGINAQISEVYFGPSCANQQQVFANVLNRGWVSAVFHTSLVKCENATAVEKEVNARKIEPHESKQYVMTVEGNPPDKETETASCIVELLNEADSLVAAREVQFRLGERCICEAHCHCECLSSDLVCRPMSQEEYHVAGFRGLAPNLMFHSPHVGYQVALVFIVTCFLLFLLGICKGLLGIVWPAISHLGLSLFTTNKRLPRYHEKELWGMTVVYNDEGTPVHPVSGQAVQRMGLTTEFFINVVFFFYIPFFGVHYCLLKTFQGNPDQKKADYQPKKFRPELPSVDEESQEEEEDPIYENVFTPVMMKVEKKTSQDSQEYLNAGHAPHYHGSNTTNHEELFSQDSEEEIYSGDTLKRRRSKRKGSHQKKTSVPELQLSEITEDSDIQISSAHSSRKHSKTSQKRKDSRGSERNLHVGSGRSSKTSSRSSKSKERKLDRNSDDTDRVKSGSADTLKTLSRSSSKSTKGKQDRSIQDLEGLNESGQSSQQPSAGGSDEYPGSARKYSIPFSQRTIRGSVRSRISSLIFKKASSSESSSPLGSADQGSIQSAGTTSPSAAVSSNRSSKLSISGKSTAYDEVLKLARSGKRVYYNFNKADDRLAGLGKVYSMCGCIHVQGGAFVFDLDIHNVQVYSNEGGRRVELDEPRVLNSDDFRRVMSAEECLQVITLFPMHPCLNKVLINDSDSGGSIENPSSHSMFFTDH